MIRQCQVEKQKRHEFLDFFTPRDLASRVSKGMEPTRSSPTMDSPCKVMSLEALIVSPDFFEEPSCWERLC